MTHPASGPCPAWAELLTATHPDDLSPSQQDALEAHLATCPACAAVRADYLRLDGYIQRLPTSRPLPAFPPQLLASGASRRAGQRRAAHTAAHPGERANAPRLIPQQKGYSAMPLGRTRGVAALVSLALIVALFVVVFRGFTAGHTVKTNTAAYNTTSAPAGQWTAIPGLTNQAALPIIAPSNPHVVYELSYPLSAPAHVTIRRSENDGATWQQVSLPSGNLPPIDVSSLAVSPIDASTIFLTLTTVLSNHPGYPCGAAQASSGPIDALIHFSGGSSCSAQYISSDGGQHWSRIQLPYIGAIGAPYFQQFFTSISTDDIHAQGQRLYTTLGETNSGGIAEGISLHIVASDDGGKSWKLVDDTVSVSGQLICDFTAASSGSTLFIIAQSEATFCYSDAGITDNLWRSDDGGATWTEVGKLPAIASNMLVVSRGAGAQPLLYIHMPETVTGGALQPTNNPPELEVSADGGKTWQMAPTKGLPAGATTSYGPLGTLGDGSVLKAFLTPDQTLTLSIWKNGETTWQPLVKNITPNVAYLFVTSNDGKTAIWLVSQSSANPNNTTYSVQRYDLK
ncbi:MAG TPA: zf-HC2 domain-containing protein [Ktedonobacterales bacterium]|nr:zf-HC2 domain-containing protein [Ktedonobacterales bacterium]